MRPHSSFIIRPFTSDECLLTPSHCPIHRGLALGAARLLLPLGHDEEHLARWIESEERGLLSAEELVAVCVQVCSYACKQCKQY